MRFGTFIAFTVTTCTICHPSPVIFIVFNTSGDILDVITDDWARHKRLVQLNAIESVSLLFIAFSSQSPSFPVTSCDCLAFDPTLSIVQGITVFKTGVVQRKRKKTLEALGAASMYPRVHALTFDPKVTTTTSIPFQPPQQSLNVASHQ